MCGLRHQLILERNRLLNDHHTVFTLQSLNLLRHFGGVALFTVLPGVDQFRVLSSVTELHLTDNVQV